MSNTCILATSGNWTDKPWVYMLSALTDWASNRLQSINDFFVLMKSLCYFSQYQFYKKNYFVGKSAIDQFEALSFNFFINLSVWNFKKFVSFKIYIVWLLFEAWKKKKKKALVLTLLNSVRAWTLKKKFLKTKLMHPFIFIFIYTYSIKFKFLKFYNCILKYLNYLLNNISYQKISVATRDWTQTPSSLQPTALTDWAIFSYCN